MKKYLFIASAALLALAACSKVNYVEEPDQQITFSVVNYVNSTKADTGVKYEGTEFGSYAFLVPQGKKFDNTDVTDATMAKYMNNVKVSKNTNNQWVPDGAYFWPKAATLTFASYSPYMAQNAPEFTKANGWAMTSYTVNENNGEATADLMFSDVSKSKDCTVDTNTDGQAILDSQDDGADSKYTGVPTLFSHKLSKIGFSFKTVEEKAAPTVESFTITVTSAKLLYIAKTAAYAETSGNPSGSWNFTYGADVVGEYAYTVPSNALSTTASDEVFKVLMPQNLSETYTADDKTYTPSLELTYKINTVYEDGTEVPEEITQVIALSDANKAGATDKITSWGINQHVLYTVTIYPFATQKIVYDPAVVKWDETINGELTIQ